MIFRLRERAAWVCNSDFVETYFPVAIASLLILLIPPKLSSEPLSNRIASYSIDVRLNPQSHSIDAQEILVWHNTSAESVAELYLHLYPNAYKSDATTFMTESGKELPPGGSGWIDVLKLADARTNQDLTGYIRYQSPDDGNSHDSTVMVVQLGRPVRPGDSVEVSIDFHEQLPQDIGRGGWTPGSEFYSVTRWFPKVGVFQNGTWNCHQYHAFTESFSDFGIYDVEITVPSKYVLGATGVELDKSTAADGTTSYHFTADDVRDFGWIASPAYLKLTHTFKYPNLPETRVVLLLQSEHRNLANRYFAAVDTAMRYFGSWYGPYPYRVITVVDPPRSAGVSGMEVPSLIAAGADERTPGSYRSLEDAITSEFSHQYWYSVVAVNAIEEAWLDKGMSAYSSDEVIDKAYGADTATFRIGNVCSLYMLPLASVNGFPVASIFGRILIRGPFNRLLLYLDYAATDAISEYGYRVRDRGAYEMIAVNKPELVLKTLEGLVGKDEMRQIMRTFFTDYRFEHPAASDFKSVCEQVSGRDLGWFFKEFIDGTGTIDFAVKSIDYYSQTDLGSGASTYITRITVVRNGEVKMPVDLRLSLDDGNSVDTVWDGENRWQPIVFRTNAPPEYAILDPLGKIPMDTDYANNSIRLHSFLLPVFKWVGRVFAYFQNMLLNIGMLA